jgi:tripartite ATP-independent transporter DctM subunit
LAGVVPGILIAGSQMLAVYIFAKIYNYPIYARSSFKEFFVAIFHAVPPLMTPLIIVGGIVGGFFTPTEASVIAVLYSVLLGGIFYRTIGFHNLPSILYNSAKFAAMSLFCIGTASAFGWILAYFKIPLAVVEVLAPYGVGPVSTGLIVAASFLLIGMFIDAIPAIIILGTVLWPLAEVSHMHPIHFAIIGVISLAFGLVTPPYGLCLLIACKVGDIEVKQALRDVAIVLMPMFVVLLIVIFFPELILALPKLLMAKFI